MPTNTLGSPNISIFDIKVVGDICAGNIIVDATPSVFINPANVLGVRVKITNPEGVEIKPYLYVGYDIVNSFTSSITLPIPTIDGNYDYGVYFIEATIFDTGGATWKIEKHLNICQPDSKNKALKYGTITAAIDDDCNEGKVYIKVNEPPVYKGFLSNSKTQSYKLTYPSSSLFPPLNALSGKFSVPLFQGEYILTGDVCATYVAGDNIFYKVPYKVNCSKDIKCFVDMCAVADRLAQIDSELNSCSQEDVHEVTNKIIDILRLLSTIEWAKKCGKEVSSYIEQLEKLLGCSCTCSITEGTPILNNTPSNNFLINGCNISSVTTGLTTTYTINNYSYKITANPIQNILSISSPQLNGCEYVQELNFDISNLNTALKAEITNKQDFLDWATIFKKGYTPNQSTLDCMGLTLAQYNLLNGAEYQSLIWSKICGGVSNNTCNALISALSYTKSGSNIVLNWTNNNAVKKVDIFLNGDFVDSVLYPLSTYTILGGANGITNNITAIAYCDNNTKGNQLTITYSELGCPSILPPNVSQSSVTNASCPFNLNSLLGTPPLGIQYEWHSANNTFASSLVTSPTLAITGNYFVFAKDANGCYSLGTPFVLNCATNTCSAPQGGSALKNNFGVLVSFNSALYPPTSGYTVKRKLAIDADLPANYTTLSAPVYNAGSGKWEVLDTTALDNTAYNYKLISNCTSGEQSVLINFSNIICPSVLLTSTTTSVSYSFAHVGGQVDKYVLELLDSTGTILLETKTHALPFGATINSSFATVLNSSTNYKVNVITYIGTILESCNQLSVNTSTANNFTITKVNAGNTSITAKVNGNGIYNGNVANGTPINGYSALIPTTSATVEIQTPAAIVSATLNGAAPTSQPSSNVCIWNNITATQLLINVNN